MITAGVSRWFFIGLWSFMTVYLVATEGYETAGIKTYALYFGFTFLCGFAVYLSMKNNSKWPFLIMSLAVLLGVPTFVAVWYNAKFSQTMKIGRAIHEQCKRDDRCPVEINGWENFSDGHFRNGQLHYRQSADTFDLYYHIGPDFDFWVRGGVGKPLQAKLEAN